MIAVIDYGAGNLQSVKNALDRIGAESVVTSDADVIASASHVILPGVGAFGDAMHALEASGLVPAVKQAAESKPFLGICLGMQLLFESSEESPGVRGLGLLKGQICRIPSGYGLKVPHIGWNSIRLHQNGGVFAGTKDDSYFYFVHSYYLCGAAPDVVAATTHYGVEIECAVQCGRLAATQFHPEKSSAPGLAVLKNFVGEGN